MILLPIALLILGFVATWFWLQWRKTGRILARQDLKIAQDEAINAAIEHWHTSRSTVPLHEYLGMTKEQYSQWLRDPDSVTWDDISGCKK